MKNIYLVLEEIGVSYQKFDHPPVFTVEESKKYERGAGAHSKNLFLRNKKGNKHFLVVLDASKKVDLKELASTLEEPALSFASEERLLKFLGLTPGSVSPFGLINDEHRQVKVIIDQNLLSSEHQGFHPNINTSTLVISTPDFKKFLNSTQNDVIYLEL